MCHDVLAMFRVVKVHRYAKPSTTHRANGSESKHDEKDSFMPLIVKSFFIFFALVFGLQKYRGLCTQRQLWDSCASNGDTGSTQIVPNVYFLI